MALHVIVGAGPVGSATARHLVELGHTVRVVTRRGHGPSIGVNASRTDANDTAPASRGAPNPSTTARIPRTIAGPSCGRRWRPPSSRPRSVAAPSSSR